MSEDINIVAPARRRIMARPVVWVIWAVLAFFFVNLAGVVFSVVVDSFSTQWFGTWWPAGLTVEYWQSAWHDFDIGSVLIVTLQVSLSVVVVSALVGVPAAYVLARRQFPFKRLGAEPP